MTPVRDLEHLATESRRRNLAPIGFRIAVPDTFTLELVEDGPVIARGQETADGVEVGAFEIAILTTRLVIDRDGPLRRAALAAAEAWAAEANGRVGRTHGVTFESGVTGTGVEVAVRPVPGQPRPARNYLHVLALTVEGELTGGVLVQLWSARAEWPAGHALLDSLRIVPLRGIGAAGQGGFGLPFTRG
jgi:hypothetical protein